MICLQHILFYLWCMVSKPTYSNLVLLYTNKIFETSIPDAKAKGTGFFNAFTPKIIPDFKKISKLMRNLKVHEDAPEENLTCEIQALINSLLTWSSDNHILSMLRNLSHSNGSNSLARGKMGY